MYAENASAHAIKVPPACYGWVDISDQGTLVERKQFSEEVIQELRAMNASGVRLEAPVQDYGTWKGVGFLILADCAHASATLGEALLAKKPSVPRFSKLFAAHKVQFFSDPESHPEAGHLFAYDIHAKPMIRTRLKRFSLAVKGRYSVEDCLVSLKYQHKGSGRLGELPMGMAIGIGLNRLGLPVIDYSGVGDTFFILFYDQCEWKINMAADAVHYAEEHEKMVDIPIIQTGKYKFGPFGSTYVPR